MKSKRGNQFDISVLVSKLFETRDFSLLLHKEIWITSFSIPRLG